MKAHFLALFMTVSASCLGTSWEKVIDQHRNLFSRQTILPDQQKAFVASQAPSIVDSRIKGIPIRENGEPLIDLKAEGCQRISMMESPSFPFESPRFQSGLPEASKIRIGLFKKLAAMVQELDTISPYFGYEPGRIDIKVFEGLRDLKTQKKLFDKKVEEIRLSFPNLTLDMAEEEASKWVSPYNNNVPVHSTGAAVDIRLWDNRTQTFLDLGSFGVIWGKNDKAPTFSETISDRQKQNRLYCLIAAEKAGLTNYLYEYWHFSSGDRYASFWNMKDPSLRAACYGPIP